MIIKLILAVLVLFAAASLIGRFLAYLGRGLDYPENDPNEW